ncbi:MAG: HEAT repeat domain-containing protein [Candidatus Riflebacteria bacterium]|nr:HEAT repeat domain-containing protein [Candidatus Riflebacteria bacterium]
MVDELEDLVTDLKSTLITKRLKSVKALGKLKTPLAAEPLRDMLSDRSKEVRCAAIEALSLVKPPRLAEILLPLATDRSADVRLRIAHALGECDGDDASRILLELMHDTKDDVADMAARCLAKNPRSSLVHLIRAFGDKSWKVRRRSADAIGRMGRAAVEALRTALAESDANIRFWAALCLGRLKDRTHIGDLLAKLTDPNVGVRIAALRALREIGDPSVVNKLFEALSQPSEQVRDVIYDILKDFGSHSIPFLMESLSNDFWMGRSLAARALSEMGSDAVVPLTAALESQDKERRYWAIRILGQMRESGALPEVRKFLIDSDVEIRMATVQALGDFQQPESIPVLIERFLDPAWVVRRETQRTIVRFGETALGPLMRALDSTEEDIRYWALRSIGEIKPRAVFPVLVKLLKDRSWNIRKTTADVLARCGEEALIDLTSLATEADSEVRYWVLQTLGTIGSNISLPLLFRGLEDSSDSIRTASQKALANYGVSILDDLISMFKSDNRRLLESVVATLQHMPADVVVMRLCQCLGKYDDHTSFWLRRALAGFVKQARKPVKMLLESKGNEVRRQAILTLGAVGISADAEDLMTHLKDEHWPCRVAAADSLGRLGNSVAIDGLMDALEDDDEELTLAAAKSLGAIGDDRAVPALLTALGRESWTIKFQVIGILGRMRVRRAVPDLLRILDEDMLDLKVPVIKALGEIAHPESLKPLRERFAREIDFEARVAYIDALARLGASFVIPDLLLLIKPDHPWEERRAAIRALGMLKAGEAKTPLLEMLRDPDPFLSREAMTSLKQVMSPQEFIAMEEKLTTARLRQETFGRHFQEGMRLMRLGAMADAERELKNALKVNPKAPYVYSALGNLYYKTGKLIDSTKAYVMAVTVEPRDVTLRLNLGMVYYRRRAYKEALETFNMLVRMCDSTSQQSIYAARMIEKIKIEARQDPGTKS